MQTNEYLKGLASVWPEDTEQLPQTVYFEPPKKRQYNIKWLLLWQDESGVGVSIKEQSKMGKLTLSDYRVRDWLLGTIGIGNMCYVNQREIARQLHLRPNTICDSIKRLIASQILIAGPVSGNAKTYMINPAFCFSGGLGNGVQQRKDVIKQMQQHKIIDFVKH